MGHTVIPLNRWEKPPQEFDYFFHCSAYGNHINQTDVEEIKKANIDLLWFYLMETIHVPYKAFINISTSSVLLPVQTMYSATKLAGELLCSMVRTQKNKPIVSVRPFSLYGPNDGNDHLIPTVIQSLRRNEVIELVYDAVHDWIFVEDFVDALMVIIEKIKTIKNSSLSVGTGIQTSNVDIVTMISRIMIVPSRVKRIDRLRSYDTDLWKAKTKEIFSLGWRPKHTLQEGLKKTIALYE
mgnify:FL=1